jgi:pimeloyl-ACP methyl ester carboxylesterase
MATTLANVRWGTRGARVVLLFVHGHTSSKETWKCLYDSFLEHDCIAIDLRGHGESPLPEDDDYSAISCGADIEQTIDEELKSDRKLFVVGHSMGSRVVVPFAVKHHNRVSGVIIEDLDFTARGKDSNPIQIADPEELKQFQNFHPTQESVRTALSQYGFSMEMIEKWLTTDRVLKKEDGFWSCVHPRSAHHSWNQLLVPSNFDAFRNLARLNLPTLLMVAASHSAVSEYGVEKMKSVMPKLICHTVPGSSHSIHRTNKPDFIRLVSQFISENS